MITIENILTQHVVVSQSIKYICKEKKDCYMTHLCYKKIALPFHKTHFFLYKMINKSEKYISGKPHCVRNT